jgi:hypothetical protein
VLYAPYQEVGSGFPRTPREDFASAVKLILPDGEVRSGAHAVFSALALVPGKRGMLWCYDHVPGVPAVSEAAYGVIARHRSFGYQVTRLFWGIPLEPETYRLSSWLFLRILGVIYFIAFVSFGIQAAGLIGSRGILPLADYLRAAHEYLGTPAYWDLPTLYSGSTRAMPSSKRIGSPESVSRLFFSSASTGAPFDSRCSCCTSP